VYSLQYSEGFEFSDNIVSLFHMTCIIGVHVTDCAMCRHTNTGLVSNSVSTVRFVGYIVCGKSSTVVDALVLFGVFPSKKVPRRVCGVL
jgi:hypothetical protein